MYRNKFLTIYKYETADRLTAGFVLHPSFDNNVFEVANYLTIYPLLSPKHAIQSIHTIELISYNFLSTI